MHECMGVRVHGCMVVWAHVCMGVGVDVCTCVRVCMVYGYGVCMWICVSVCMGVWMCVCTCVGTVCMDVWECMGASVYVLRGDTCIDVWMYDVWVHTVGVRVWVCVHTIGAPSHAHTTLTSQVQLREVYQLPQCRGEGSSALSAKTVVCCPPQKH